MTKTYQPLFSAANLRAALFVTLFMAAHKTPPRCIVLDPGATDDPIHGHQEGWFLHGYYDCYCYLPPYIFCGRHLQAARLDQAGKHRRRRGGHGRGGADRSARR